VRAAAVQLNSTEDLDRNLETADRLVREAAAAGAELVILPEKWNVLGRAEVMHAAAERTANTCVHFTKTGRQTAYRKLHMFDVEVDGVVYAESAHEQPGDEVVVSELADGGAGGIRIGLSICYDVRFPELYRELSARGAEIIAVPAAFTLATTRDHWEVLLRARAIENQCFVVAPNQVGAYPPGNRSGGRSMIVDPWGLVLACAPDTECVIVAELDFDNLRGIRRRLPALQHRRPEIYERTAV
jgi:predicted amidohydrolase